MSRMARSGHYELRNGIKGGEAHFGVVLLALVGEGAAGGAVQLAARQ